MDISVLHLDGVRESDEISGISGINGLDGVLICEQVGDSLFVTICYKLDCNILQCGNEFLQKFYQQEDEDFFRVQLTKDRNTSALRK